MNLPTASIANQELFESALKLFEKGRISSGKAGQLCEMERVEFLLAAGQAGVPLVDLSAEEISEEFDMKPNIP